jgi:hypothetical protein
MEPQLNLLLDILEIESALREQADTLQLVPIVDFATVILGTMLPKTSAVELAQTIRRIVQENTPLGRSVVALQQGARQIAQEAHADENRVRRLGTLVALAQIIAAINRGTIGPQQMVRQMHLNLGALPLLEYIQSWHIQGQSGQPTFILVGQPTVGPNGLIIRTRGCHYIERRITLRYIASHREPFVHVPMLSSTLFETRPRNERTWRQRAHPDYDLTIFTEQERIVGFMRTRAETKQLVIPGIALTIALPATAEHPIIITDIVDADNQPLVRVLRVI